MVKLPYKRDFAIREWRRLKRRHDSRCFDAEGACLATLQLSLCVSVLNRRNQGLARRRGLNAAMHDVRSTDRLPVKPRVGTVVWLE